MFTLENGVLRLETATQTAVVENGRITSLVSKATGKRYIACSGDEVGLIAHWRGGLEDPWPENETKRLDTGKVEIRLLSSSRAEILFHSWYGDGLLMITEDPETGDLCFRPSVTSDRAGVKAAGWEFRGVSPELYAVVPANQGVRLKLDDPLLAGSCFGWPLAWEIGMCIFESEEKDGFWVHCRDTKYQYKDLRFGKDLDVGSFELMAEAYGPLDDNTSAGGITWRLNCFTGGWRVPAKAYRDWYYRAYDLERDRANRMPWLKDIRMGISWADANTEVLDELAKKVDPHKVLIHMATWRDAKYDQEYPDYWPSKAAEQYIRHGTELGFHICPHMNSMEIDPSHSVYPMLSGFQMRNVDSRTVYGWGWDGPAWKYLGVPWTEFAKRDPRNREYNIMTKIHTGASAWHAELYDRMAKVAEAYPVAGCFIDVTLCTYNLHNALVEGRTSTEGLNDLIHMLSEIRGGLPIGGEGLNEITAQGLSFAQMHLYRSGHISCPGLERCGGDVAVNDFVFGDLCRTMGYATLSGKTEDEALRSRIYDDHNTIPTITTNNPEEIRNPNPVVASIFEKTK